MEVNNTITGAAIGPEQERGQASVCCKLLDQSRNPDVGGQYSAYMCMVMVMGMCKGMCKGVCMVMGIHKGMVMVMGIHKGMYMVMGMGMIMFMKTRPEDATIIIA